MAYDTDPIPEDIKPARHINKLIGACLLAIAVMPMLPIVAVLYYDGILSFLDWPSIFNWFAATAALLIGSGIYMIVTPQRVGAEVRFHQNGFHLRMRVYFRKTQEHDFTWSDIETVEHASAGTNNDSVGVKTKSGATATFPTKFTETTAQHALKKLRASAKAAGYRFERDSGFNALIVSRTVWRILPEG